MSTYKSEHVCWRWSRPGCDGDATRRQLLRNTSNGARMSQKVCDADAACPAGWEILSDKPLVDSRTVNTVPVSNTVTHQSAVGRQRTPQ